VGIYDLKLNIYLTNQPESADSDRKRNINTKLSQSIYQQKVLLNKDKNFPIKIHQVLTAITQNGMKN